jgi:hypothetical protein
MLAERFGANQEHSLEYWNNGMMEQWVRAFILFAHRSNIPVFLSEGLELNRPAARNKGCDWKPSGLK